ncbi:methyltransferase type 11 [Candidatus Magnetobacterium bavaricum]|uniref:Arsenite methyltransferase n=1 Tax=Candidatus Magnetobacterium bavaricum TaxID=29290 RepID=A0A0F3GXT8_9BACT|nr:methyltransferase type 11 [Candidatus Magnetobacterium bavaricum]
MVNIDIKDLRCAINREYAEVATNPLKGFHFHTGHKLAELLGYTEMWPDSLPESWPKNWMDEIPAGAVESFAGTGNPFSIDDIRPGQRVVDVGSGAGFDSFIAARLVGPSGRVVGVEMTPEMLHKAQALAKDAMMPQLEFLPGNAESLPVADEWADVVISNGVVNLCPDKQAVFKEMFRVLRPGGKIQIGDISVSVPVPESARGDIALWCE